MRLSRKTTMAIRQLIAQQQAILAAIDAAIKALQVVEKTCD